MDTEEYVTRAEAAKRQCFALLRVNRRRWRVMEINTIIGQQAIDLSKQPYEYLGDHLELGAVQVGEADRIDFNHEEAKAVLHHLLAGRPRHELDKVLRKRG